MSEIRIRRATEDDAAGCLAIYLPNITESAASFELEVPPVVEYAERIARANAAHAWLVAESEDTVMGFAYAGVHRVRAAYRHSAEVSVYVGDAFQGRGLGTRLYAELFSVLSEQGYFNAYAGITLPNAGSVALHRSFGFESIGTFPRIGFKFGAWHDVSWWFLSIQEGQPETEPLPREDG